MQYRVIKEFHDLTDATVAKDGKIFWHYAVGDLYPRAGLKPDSVRIKELAGCDNAQGQPLIEAVDEASEAGTEASASAGQEAMAKPANKKRASRKKAADPKEMTVMPGA